MTVKQTRGSVITPTTLLLAALCLEPVWRVSHVSGRPKLIQSQLPAAAQETAPPGMLHPQNSWPHSSAFLLVKSSWGKHPYLQPADRNLHSERQPDKDLGAVPTGDEYFLGRLDFQRRVVIRSLLPQSSLPVELSGTCRPVTGLYSTHYQQNLLLAQFCWIRAALIASITIFGSSAASFWVIFAAWCLRLIRNGTPDGGFPRSHLGGDQDYNIVRINGAFSPSHIFL
jgi:hypothetical protein